MSEQAASSSRLFLGRPRFFSMVVAFPDTEKLIGRGPAKLLDASMVNTAPTNFLIYVSSVSILSETVVL